MNFECKRAELKYIKFYSLVTIVNICYKFSIYNSEKIA